MCRCDSARILKPWYHIDGIMKCIKYEVTESLGVKCTAHSCMDGMVPVVGHS